MVTIIGLFGQKLIDKMIEEFAFAYCFERKEKAKTLADSSCFDTGSDRKFDSALLFQRMHVASKSRDISMTEVFHHELCPFTPALFDAICILKKPDKAQLAKAVDEHVNFLSDNTVTDNVPMTECSVLDGGSLIHCLQWQEVWRNFGCIHSIFTTNLWKSNSCF